MSETARPSASAAAAAPAEDALWPGLGAVPADIEAALRAASERHDYAAGETLVTIGQYDDSQVTVVLSGRVRVTRTLGATGEIAVEELGPGEAVGLRALILDEAPDAGAPVGASLEAASDASVRYVEAAVLRELLEGHAALALGLLRLAMRPAAAAAPGGSRARVARHLLSLAAETGGGLSVAEMPRHAALAEAAGVGEAEAAGAVASLIARGLARRAYPGLEILDRAGFEAAAR